MGESVDAVLDVSAWLSGLEGSTVVVPAFGPGAFLLLAAALLLSTIPVSQLRWLAVLPAGAGLALAASPGALRSLRRPRRGRSGGARRGRAPRARRPSLRFRGGAVAAGRRGRPSRSRDASLREGARCDRAGCVVVLEDGRAVSLVQHPAAFEEDCRRAAVIVSPLAAPARCRSALVLDRRHLDDAGATAVRLAGGAMSVSASRPAGEPRPWNRLSPVRPASRVAPPARGAPARPVDDDDADSVSSAEPD